MPNQGLYLTEIRQLYHDLRSAYLTWSTVYGRPEAVAIGHFQRALIGLYEARKQRKDAYLGDAYHYVQSAADVYFSGRHQEIARATEVQPLLSDTGAGQNPLNYLPRPVYLNEVQQTMLRQFHEQSESCQELLLLTDYHDIAYPRVAELLGYGEQVYEIADQRRKWLLMIRERWQSSGIMDPLLVPSPADEDLIDRYFHGALDVTERWNVEARRPGDTVFRTAMELREDWDDVLTVAGRQDLMETLQREEGRYAPVVAPVPASAPKVKLTPRRRTTPLGKLKLPDLQIVFALALLGAFAYLAWDTFGGTATLDRTYEAHFEPFPNLFRNNPPATADERDLDRILYYYDREFYRDAYDELLPVAAAYPAAALYLGVAALELENPVRAQQWFAQILPGDPFYEAAQWYEALSFVAQGRRPAAISILADIVERPRHSYRRRAAELLAELD